MHDVLRFWMNRGVDGFRVDAAAVLAEDALLRDDPPNPDFDETMPPPERFRRVYTDARPDSLAYLSELRQVIDEFRDRVLLGEVDTTPDKLPASMARMAAGCTCLSTIVSSPRRGARRRLRTRSARISAASRPPPVRTG
jgi:glycosidase